MILKVKESGEGNESSKKKPYLWKKTVFVVVTKYIQISIFVMSFAQFAKLCLGIFLSSSTISDPISLLIGTLFKLFTGKSPEF